VSKADLEIVCAAHHSLQTKINHWAFLTLLWTAVWMITSPLISSLLAEDINLLCKHRWCVLLSA